MKGSAAPGQLMDDVTTDHLDDTQYASLVCLEEVSAQLVVVHSSSSRTCKRVQSMASGIAQYPLPVEGALVIAGDRLAQPAYTCLGVSWFRKVTLGHVARCSRSLKMRI